MALLVLSTWKSEQKNTNLHGDSKGAEGAQNSIIIARFHGEKGCPHTEQHRTRDQMPTIIRRKSAISSRIVTTQMARDDRPVRDGKSARSTHLFQHDMTKRCMTPHTCKRAV